VGDQKKQAGASPSESDANVLLDNTPALEWAQHVHCSALQPQSLSYRPLHCRYFQNSAVLFVVPSKKKIAINHNYKK